MKHEAGGVVAEEGSANRDIFCVQAALARSRSSLQGAQWLGGWGRGCHLQGITLLLGEFIVSWEFWEFLSPIGIW